ncbi:MAG: hypothetical protein L0Z50_21605, partial [Verrucomicrobiales bacterium]|nr:hypothetical protein [Verrucomicrobiales bacterium]
KGSSKENELSVRIAERPQKKVYHLQYRKIFPGGSAEALPPQTLFKFPAISCHHPPCFNKRGTLFFDNTKSRPVLRPHQGTWVFLFPARQSSLRAVRCYLD